MVFWDFQGGSIRLQLHLRQLEYPIVLMEHIPLIFLELRFDSINKMILVKM